jgi:N-acetylmuramoyl-L-alanine amidase
MIIRLIFLILILFLWPLSARALNVDDIRFGVHTDKTRLVIALSEETSFRVFALDKPFRIVIDLPGFSWRAGQVGETPKAGIRSLRHGSLEPGYSRIVMDMAQPILVQNAFSLPQQGAQPARLVIDYTQVSPARFEREKTSVFGTLVPGQGQTQIASAINKTPVPENKPEHTGPSSPVPEQERPLVVLDPGHGGQDPGAIGKNGTSEKKITLALARELRQQLEESGRYRVLLTREKDVFIRLADRVKFARKNGADLFISMHADSIDKPDVSGASIYTLSEKASDEQTEKLAARENKADLIAGIDLNVEDEEVASILVDLAMRDTMNQSKFFAGKVVQSFKQKQLDLLDRPHRHAGFAVLKAADVPSVLIEAGFMSNRTEADLLSDPAHRARLVTAMKKSIDAYFEQVRKNQRI